MPAPQKFDQVVVFPLADTNTRTVLSPRAIIFNHNGDNGSVGPEYQLHANDVICGRGKGTFGNTGNIRFRQICLKRADQYRKAKTRVLKKQLVSEIIIAIRSIGGRFLQHQTGEYYDIGDEAAAAKVGHALRDAKNSFSKCANLSKASKKARSTGKGHTSTNIINTTGFDQLLDDIAEGMLFHPLDDDISDLDSVLRFTLEEADDILLQDILLA